MPENFNQPPTPAPEKSPSKESFEKIKELFTEVEKVFGSEGREAAKPLLISAVHAFVESNKWDRATNFGPMVWNKEGILTEAEFVELNSRRQRISNAVGMMVNNNPDNIRQDLNE